MPRLLYTPGPASLGKEAEILDAGATGVRLTFSYATQEYQLERAKLHRRAAGRFAQHFDIVADLAGEKFRLGQFDGAATVAISPGETFSLVADSHSDPFEAKTLAVTSESFFDSLSPGALITVGDGSAVLHVKDVTNNSAVLSATGDGGVLNQSRGLTVQGDQFKPRCLTTKDVADLQFVAASGAFDYVALSFVSSADDIVRARRIMASAGARLPIIAKIETAAGIDNLPEICQAAEIVMAARGDLALALPWPELPAAVLKIEAAARASASPWIVATQVVEGLERFVMPTRAEICDLARWLGGGCSGVLLSYETAFGANPVGAVAAARRLIDRWGSS